VGARVSARRLDALLLADELADDDGRGGGAPSGDGGVGGGPGSAPLAASAASLPADEGVAVELCGADFSWDAAAVDAPAAAAGASAPAEQRVALLRAASERGSAAAARAPTPTLRAIRLAVARGALVAVVGGTGDGKSSLLSAMLGDLPAVQPALGARRRGSLAYCAQASWVFAGTVRENILFGRPFDAAAYAAAVQAADLGAEIEAMGGDDAELGERGVNVSGGQKQRLSLARAHYARVRARGRWRLSRASPAPRHSQRRHARASPASQLTCRLPADPLPLWPAHRLCPLPVRRRTCTFSTTCSPRSTPPWPRASSTP
jgi:ABC-type multidrug transport system fused ATPase/permease subunit